MAKTKEKIKKEEIIENHLDENIAKWFVIYTKYKREKIVSKQLQEKNIEVYLPLVKHTRRYVRKVREVELPLFCCYLFVKIVKDEYLAVLQTENVVKFVRIAKNLIAIPEEEINTVRLVVGENMELTAEPGKFREGDEVEVIGGRLTGLRGRFVEEHGKKEFVIELSNMGYSLRINIDAKLLRKL